MKPQPAPILAWMNCYGAWDPDLRTPIETIGYDQYLDAFVHALTPFKDRVSRIVISGGMRDAHARTECETTAPELKRRLTAAGFSETLTVETDEESLTSITITRTFCQAVQDEYPALHPLLFVDAVRYQNNLFTVEHFCAQLGCGVENIRELVVPLPRFDDHPHSTPEFQASKLERMKRDGIEAVEQEEDRQRRGA